MELKQALEQRDRLRAALIALVGESSPEKLTGMAETLRSIATNDPDRDAALAGIEALLATTEGAQPTETQADRIERKLDTLIAALADEIETPVVDLDGGSSNPERDPTQPMS